MARTGVQESTLNQRLRSATLYKISKSGQRVLGLGAFSNRLATQATDAIDQDYTRRYNDGLITPEEYQSHLKDMISRPGLTPTQRTQVTDMIRDVTRNQQVSALEARYAAAQDGTSEKAAAADALAQFYSTQATSLAPGTPAQADAQQNASKWKNQSVAISTKMEKDDRTSLRYSQLARVSALPSSDPNTAAEKAQVYAVLRDEAFADGAVDEGNKYEALMQQEIQRGEKLVEQQQEAQVKEFKTGIISNMNQALDQYYDGKVGPYDVLKVLNQAEAAADQTGDYTLAVRIDSTRQRIEKEIEAEQKRGAAGARKSINETMDNVELDLNNLETAFKYGTEFTPQSDYFKQLLPPGVTSVPVDLEDLLNTRAVGFGALKKLIQQAEAAGIDVPETRVASLLEKSTQADTNVASYQQGRLVTYVDAGSGEIVYKDVDSPEELANYFVPEGGGLGAQFAKLSPAAVFSAQNQMLTTTNPGQQPQQVSGVKIKKKFLGMDFLNPDTAVQGDVAFYRTGDGGFAVNAKELGLSDNENEFYKVTNNNGTLEIDPDQTVMPAKVIVVPSAEGGFDKIYVGTDASGKPTSYFSERQNRALQAQEINSYLRGRKPEEAIAQSSQQGQEGVQPIVASPNQGQEDVAPPGPAAPRSEIDAYAAAHPEFNQQISKWAETMPQFKINSSPSINSGNFSGPQMFAPSQPKLELANPATSPFTKPIPGVNVDLGPAPSGGFKTPQPGIPQQPSWQQNLLQGGLKLLGKGTFW